jgi:hypothetical protein
MPFPVEVIILRTPEALAAVTNTPDVNGRSWYYNDPEGATLMLVADDPWLSIVAHEVAHIALLHHAYHAPPRVTARRWLHEHPEHIAELIGNLTSVLWYAIPAVDELAKMLLAAAIEEAP